MSESLLDKASEYAFAQLEDACGDVSLLPLPLQTVAVIYSAQGVIDNGGLEYFYESDFDGTPEYSFFVNAYRRIGVSGLIVPQLASKSLLQCFHLPSRTCTKQSGRNGLMGFAMMTVIHL
jgi:hypothetical protein